MGAPCPDKSKKAAAVNGKGLTRVSLHFVFIQ
jgi:hypothetical protein